MTDRMRCVLAAIVLLLSPSMALAQNSKSEPLVGELVKLLDLMKLDSVAAKVPDTPDQFVGALYFPGTQLLVVTARYSVPQRMEVQLREKSFKDVYIDLNSASIPESKIFISDLGANGLQSRRDDNQPFDIVDTGGKSYSFDGDWNRAQLSEDEYRKAFQTADEDYVKMLQALLAQLRKTS